MVHMLQTVSQKGTMLTNDCRFEFTDCFVVREKCADVSLAFMGHPKNNAPAVPESLLVRFRRLRTSLELR